MKIRSLLLGSVAAAGLSTGAYAADLGVLTALDVCDALGISGLTISSDTNCLQITGEVSYEFVWGDYDEEEEFVEFEDGDEYVLFIGDGESDWESHVDAWLKFVATADSDFGPAKAVIKLGYDGDFVDWPEDESSELVVDEAYVSIGDSTVLMAGLKGSIANMDDDAPFNYLGLFQSEHVGTGVGFTGDDSGPFATGGHVIQVVSDLGNGLSIGGGLEDLNGDGTAVGVVSYAGDGLTAHVTFLAADLLDNDPFAPEFGVHAGFTGTFDMFKVRAAVAADDSGWWNALASAEATFDMFTIAGSVEGTGQGGDNEFGAGASVGLGVTEGVDINLGFRWFVDTDGDYSYETAAQISAAVTENITVTADVGYTYEDDVGDSAIWGGVELAWAPGGGFESSIGADVVSATDGDLGYKLTFNASKAFE